MSLRLSSKKDDRTLDVSEQSFNNTEFISLPYLEHYDCGTVHESTPLSLTTIP